MIPVAIQRWHAIAEARDPAGLAELLADDVVFVSPVVHTPQAGKSIATSYLRAALSVLGNDSFRYVNAWYGERSAILEFESSCEGILINGIDMIEWNADDKITRFKVMVRPLKGINKLHELMRASLETS